MSVEMMGLVFKHGPSDGTQAFVLLAIADHADDKGRAFPGISLLAKKSRQSERNVMRVIQLLEVGGWLSVSRRAFGVKMKGNVYQMNVAKLSVEAPKSSGDRLSPDQGSSVAKTQLLNPSYDNLSPDASGDKTGVHQVTKSTSSGDKSSIPFNCINRQEPPLEPKARTPQPPAVRGARLDHSNAEAKTRNATVCEEAVAKVMRECSISDPRMNSVIARAMAVEHSKSDAPANCNATAELMILRRSAYLGDVDVLKYTVGVRKFFAHGVWADPRQWPYDDAKLSRVRRL